ncbi:MAG: T9SS type A sorting domain-containing protein, partial [candidate division Zixibacteria bacterium]|nr:T9SS type A sorting domain-containing protein [candidate division Zixibacteria bacterium]
FSYDGYIVEVTAVEDKTLKVAAVGGTEGVAGTFHFRPGGQTPYSSADMAVGADDTLRYVLPADMLGLRVLEYYFEIHRGTSTYFIGNPDAPFSFVAQFSNAFGQRPEALPDARYRIVGVPIDIPISGRGSAAPILIFGDDLGTYDKTKYRLGRYITSIDSVLEVPTLAEDVRPGYGYWLIARGAKKYGAAGKSVIPSRTEGDVPYYVTNLKQGWNQLANPFPFDMAWDLVKFEISGTVVGHDPAVIDDEAHWYGNNGYQLAYVIPAWEGFFVYVKATDATNPKILFPFVELPSFRAPAKEAPPIAASFDNWQVQMRIDADGLVDEQNFAGVKSDADDGADVYDMSKPPPPPGGPRLAFRMTDDDSRLRRCDYRAPFSEGAEWNIVIAKVPGRSLTVTGVEQVPEEMEAWLILDVGTTIRLTEGKKIYLPNDVETARLIIGTGEYAAREVAGALPRDYALYQNFPNPFNPSTSIRLALPQAGHVTLEVFNILGQTVATVVDREMPAGYHTVVWDGDDNGGSRVASGVYFYRMTSGDYQQNRKMVLLK